MYTVHHADLQTLLVATRPVSLLLLDPHPDAATVIPTGVELTRLDGDPLSQLPALGRYDLAVVANTLERLDRKTAGILLAQLRDLYARRLVVLVPIGDAWEPQASHWEMSDLLGYGLSLMARYAVDGKALHLYHYAIESYKTTPDWFNSQFWAHPERWRP